MRTMCIEICFEWLSAMDQATKLEFVVEMLQLRRLLDKTVAAQRHRATAKRLKRQGFQFGLTLSRDPLLSFFAHKKFQIVIRVLYTHTFIHLSRYTPYTKHHA